MKKLYSLTIAAGLALGLAGCTGNSNLSTAGTDKDRDGITDIQDQCPNTAVGTKVSKDGCKVYTTILDLDVKKSCDVKSNGIENVLVTANKYNTIAREHGVEFKRRGMYTKQYIDGANAAVKAGENKVVLLNKKGKKTKSSVTTEYAAWRACTFAISALQLEEEGKSVWRLEVPGDGYTY